VNEAKPDMPAGKPLSAGRIEEIFTTPEGSYRFSRWGRAIAPVVFGVDDDTLGHLKDAMAMVLEVAQMEFAETDPELGANLMIFFCSEWDELDMVPNLSQMLPDFDILKASLQRTEASQYRTFTFDENGAIRVCIVLLRFDEHMAETSVQTMGVAQMTQSILLWGDEAFEDESPIAIVPANGMCIVKPGYAALIRAAYDPALPPSSTDSSHAMRLAARAKLLLKDDGDDASV
jgi:hypothetical protein